MHSSPEGFLSAEELVHYRMISYHRQRVEAIIGGDSPFRLKPGGRLIVHLIPAETVRTRKRFTASDLKVHGKDLRPLGEQSGRHRFNEDGYLAYDGEGEVGAYSQLHRDGRLEAVTTDATYEQHGTRALRDGFCERAIFEAVGEHLRFCKGIGIAAPVWSFVALSGCHGVRGRTWHGPGEEAIQRPVVYLPEFEVESLDIEPVTHLRPLFDCLANAVGLERSLNYDERGSRTERQGW